MNKVMLIGNVGRDPEVHYYDADQAVAKFPLATTERGYTLPNGTKVPDKTTWHNIILWRSLAKVAERYVHKGDKLYIEGRLRYSYEDQKGQRRYVVEILGESMELLSPRPQTPASPAPAQGERPNAQSSEDSKSLPF